MLQTIVLGTNAVSIVNDVGIGFAIRTLTTATTGILSLAKKKNLTFKDGADMLLGQGVLANELLSNEPYSKDVTKELKDLDLECEVAIAESLIKEQEGRLNHNSVQQSLAAVTEVLDNIHRELDTIHSMIDYHQQKWFNGWRTLDCSIKISVIINHKKLFDKRYSNLCSLLMIYRHELKNTTETKDENGVMQLENNSVEIR